MLTQELKKRLKAMEDEISSNGSIDFICILNGNIEKSIDMAYKNKKITKDEIRALNEIGYKRHDLFGYFKMVEFLGF
jgi:hypothetical protein